MQKKKFVIKGPRVQGVGFRPLLVGRGKTDYHLRVYARNKNDDKVEVVVEGKEKQFKEKGEFDRFYKDIQRGKLQPKNAEVKTIGEPEPFEVNPNDYMEFTQGLQLEQMGKFVGIGKKGFNGLGGKIDGLGNKIDELPEKIAKAIRGTK